MQKIRTLLSQNPMTFNELLDLFEAYVASVLPPVLRGCDLLHSQLGGGPNDAMALIIGAADECDQMGKRLKQIRAARSTGTDVTLTLTGEEASRMETDAHEVEYLLMQAASVFGHLQAGISGGFMATDETATLAVIELAQRGMSSAAEKEGASMSMLSGRIKAAAASTRKGKAT